MLRIILEEMYLWEFGHLEQINNYKILCSLRNDKFYSFILEKACSCEINPKEAFHNKLNFFVFEELFSLIV